MSVLIINKPVPMADVLHMCCSYYIYVPNSKDNITHCSLPAKIQGAVLLLHLVYAC